MPTSRRRVLRPALGLMPAALALAACAPMPETGSPSRANVSVAGETIAVAAPTGFCIDRASTTTSANGAFVMVSDCSLLGEAGGTTPPVAAMMTASISADPGLVAEGSDTTLDDLEAFLGTERGRATVGRSGDAAATRIVQTSRGDDVLFVLVEDRGRSPIPGVEPRFWRAFMTVNGRMAALSIQGFDGAAPDPQSSLNHLAAFARALRAANPRA